MTSTLSLKSEIRNPKSETNPKIRVLILILLFFGSITIQVRAAEEQKPLNELKGLIILNSQEAVLKEGDPGLVADGLQVKDLAFLKGSDFAKAMQPFFGRTVDGELLKAIQVAIRNYYRRNGLRWWIRSSLPKP